MLRSIAAVLIIATVVSADAQTLDSQPTPAPSQTAIPKTHTIDMWPGNNQMSQYEKFDIITSSKPTIRQPCHPVQVTSDEILCKEIREQKQVEFKRDDVVGIIDAANHSDRNALIVYFAVSSAALAASFFVPLGWAVTLRIIAGFSAWASAWDEGPSDHGDQIVYRRPGTTLSVRLHK